MNAAPRKIDLDEWDDRYAELKRSGLQEAWYGGPLRRHLSQGGNLRLQHLHFDNSSASLRLWNFLLTENDRLRQAQAQGHKLVGAMKDLGTVPVMAFSLPNVRAFYPDGAWWTPCLMECSDHLLNQAEALGIDASFCPVRAMLAAFENGEHFPKPDLLICSTGAVCDDFSAIAQRLEHRGFPVSWWEIPRRRNAEPDEESCPLPGGGQAPRIQVGWVRGEFERLGAELTRLAGHSLDEATLKEGIRAANTIRRALRALRQTVYLAPGSPLPALEMLVVEMLAIHFCSDREESLAVINALIREAQQRLERGQSIVNDQAVRIYWVNPVADLRAMSLLEDKGARLCGTDFMFTHALDPIPEDLPPYEALARMALADPMIGSARDRARRIMEECRAARAEAVIVAKIPGSSHGPWEGAAIREEVRSGIDLPVFELEIPPVCDAMLPTLGGRLEAVIETAKARRKS